MKILFVNAPWFTKGFIGIRAGSRWAHVRGIKSQLKYAPFPFKMAYSAAILEKNNVKVKIIDTLAEEMRENEFLKTVKKFSPDLVVSECSTPSIYIDYQNAEKIKQTVDTKIAFVGNHISALPNEVLKNENVDFGLMGEYDYTLRDLVLNFGKEKRYSKTLGLAYKKSNKIYVNKRRPLIKNLDDLPLPARHLFKMENYNESFCGHFPNMQVLTSRGCPFSCIFCLEPWVIYGKSYRVRSIPSVLEEIEMLMNTYKPNEIYFDDSTFTVFEKRTIDLCEGMMNRGLDIPWSCMTTANCIRNKKMLEKMRESGCERIKIGLESADEDVLRIIGKPYVLTHVRKVLEWAKECDLKIHLTSMVGLPGQTIHSVRKTKRFIQSLAKKGLVYSLQTSFAVPFPGTKFYEMAKKNKWLITENWAKYDGSCNCVVSYPKLTKEEIVKLQNELRSSWKYSSLPPSLLLQKVNRLINQRGILSGSWWSFKKTIDYIYHKIVGY